MYVLKSGQHYVRFAPGYKGTDYYARLSEATRFVTINEILTGLQVRLREFCNASPGCHGVLDRDFTIEKIVEKREVVVTQTAEAI